MQSSLRWCTAEIQERSEGCYKLCGNNRGMWKTRTFWGARQVSPSSPQSGRTIEESWSWKNWGTRTTSTECISRIQKGLGRSWKVNMQKTHRLVEGYDDWSMKLWIAARLMLHYVCKKYGIEVPFGHEIKDKEATSSIPMLKGLREIPKFVVT